MEDIEKHILAANLQPPKPNQQVFKDDCAYCFDTPDSSFGLDVCLVCFSSSSPDPSHDYTSYHRELTGHDIYLNLKRVPKAAPEKTESPKKMAKLAIEADKEEDHYETTTSVKDLAFPGVEVDRTLGNLPAVIDGVLNATSYARREEIQAWELEIKPCNHISSLTQDPKKDCFSLDKLDKCQKCDLEENLWLCLTCGYLGCGRAQFGGVGGNSHGLAHYEEWGHVASVKLGSITPEGNADVFCYACSEEVVDPNLTDHLHHWGINIADRVQTEKSLTEMQIEQNLKWDFSMTTDDGKELAPLFGPGITGIRNLGNSCYMSSVLQSVFSLPGFQARFNQMSNLEFKPTSKEPANNLEVQLRKLADGLLSGRYSIPSNDTESDNPHQKGISPGMFKALIGRGHEEFSTMRQQDAFEFFIYLMDKISSDCRKQGAPDPSKVFQFETEQRLQCQTCKRVRYVTEPQESISFPVPARKKQKNDDNEGDSKEEYETIQLKECLDLYTESGAVDFQCNCGNKGATTQTSFKSFPDVLVLNARRFQIVNWVPTKLDIPVEVSDEEFTLDNYLSSGKQDNEEEMEEDAGDGENSGDAPFEFNEAALGQLEQMGMPRIRAQKALYATGNSDAESAMNWLLEHMEDADIDTPVTFTKAGGNDSKSNEPSPDQMVMLTSMGFTEVQAKNALIKNKGNIEQAADWLFQNPEAANEVDLPDAPPAAEEEGPRGDASLPARYRLKSIICHKGGSIHAGHYVAFVKKDIGDGEGAKWVLFNDEKVVQGGEVEEMKKFAYVYMFERVR